MKLDRNIETDRQKMKDYLPTGHTSRPDKVLFFANPHFLFFNFFANPHCTHLPLLAYAQAKPKAKSKECNRNSFINFT
ncbi:hypothetical protein D4R20_00295 [bacterium]|nr:MAG: hypothetical protein D4R20_00295 [bacterium]